VRRFGRLDVLFNNAGVHGTGDTPETRWDHCLDTNLKPPYLASLAALPHMRKVGGGSIINTASISGPVVGFASPHYDASKAGLVGLTRSLASRFGKYNIRVNAICPGFIVTPFIGPGWTKQSLESVKADVALGRLGKPEEIAQVALFLASGESSYVTGAAIVADGGWTIHYARY
jgi:NAD(P)-dependent dehydrogenase (short-subunit alcohol dehydrogenase family)